MRESPDKRFRHRNGFIRAITTFRRQVDTDMQSTSLLDPDRTVTYDFTRQVMQYRDEVHRIVRLSAISKQITSIA